MVKFTSIKGVLSLAIVGVLISIFFSSCQEEPCQNRIKAKAVQGLKIDEKELRECYGSRTLSPYSF